MASKRTIEELRARISAIESASPSKAAGDAGPTIPSSGLAPEAPVEMPDRSAEREHGCTTSPSTTSSDDPVEKALSKIVALVNVSERSEAGLRSRLKASQFDDDVIEAALDRARDYGYVSNQRFAAVLIRSRLSQGRGEAGIRRELDENGIDLDEIEGWPEEFEYRPEDESERALDYIRKHPSRSKNRREGAYRKLVQKGFSSSAASEAARMWASEA